MGNSVVERQVKLLKGFEKVFIRAGETVDVGISISLDELRYYSVEENQWVLESGEYNFMVGPDSSEASCLKSSLELKI
jgi:beta-glucosidase